MSQQAQALDNDIVDKIFAYIEREAGRDAPLTPQDKAMVEARLASDPEALAMANDMRKTNETLEILFADASLDVPDHLVSLVRSHGITEAGDQEEREAGRVIPFVPAPAAEKKTWDYQPLAAAASFLLFIAAGGLAYQFNAHDLQRQHYELELAKQSSELEQRALERTALRRRLASLEALGTQPVGGGIVRSYGDRTETPEGPRLKALQHRMTELTGALVDRDQELDVIRKALAVAKQEAAAQLEKSSEERTQARTRLAQVEKRLARTNDDMAALQTERNSLSTKYAQGRERIVSLEAAMTDSLGKIVSLNTANDVLAGEKERFREQASWLNQVAGYHRGYAGTMREVEVTAAEEDETQALTKWLANTMGRDFTVPDLSRVNLTFVGGRVFFVDGKPTAQIAYHDDQGRLTGFCFTAKPGDPDTDPKRTQNDDLNLVSWTKNDVEYVMVGWNAASELDWIAGELQRQYGDNI